MMFRWSALLVAPLLMFTAACGGDEDDAEGTEDTPSPTWTESVDPEGNDLDGDGADGGTDAGGQDGSESPDGSQSGGGSNDSSGGDGRPTAQELAAAIRASDPSGEIADAEAQCIADVLDGAGFSDEYLRALADNDLDHEISEADADLMVDAVEPMMACMEQ